VNAVNEIGSWKLVKYNWVIDFVFSQATDSREEKHLSLISSPFSSVSGNAALNVTETDEKV
jgi:hypothetical protein